MNTKQKLRNFLFARENIYIILLFLSFYALRTQINNLMFFLFDLFFLNGDLQSTFTFNYKGDLVGCKEIFSIKGNPEKYNWLQRNGFSFVQYIPSILAFLLLVKHNFKSRLWFWSLVVICCLSVLEAIIFAQMLLSGGLSTSAEGSFLIYAICITFISMGLYIFFKMMRIKEQLKVVLIAFPFFVLGFFLWYRWIGPKILPIVS